MSIVISNGIKKYGDKVIFSGVDKTFEAGKHYVIMGESGCGKTTLLRCILGLENLDEGRISYSGKKMSVVFQETRLLEKENAYKNVALVLRNQKKQKDQILQHLTRLGLGDSLMQPVKELSGGMKQRVNIVRGMLVDADTYILDEPLKGLDENTKQLVMEYLEECCKDKTMILVTHERAEADFFVGKGAEIVKL